MTWNKIQEISFTNNERSSFIFEENHVFIEEETLQSNKVFTVEGELDGIDIDGIGNLLDLPGLIGSMKNVGILKYSLMVESLNNDRKRMSEVLRAYIWPFFDKCYKRDWGKYDCIEVWLRYDWGKCGYIFSWVGSKWIKRKERLLRHAESNIPSLL